MAPHEAEAEIRRVAQSFVPLLPHLGSQQGTAIAFGALCMALAALIDATYPPGDPRRERWTENACTVVRELIADLARRRAN